MLVRVSVKLAAVSAIEFGLVIVSVIVEVPLAAMDVGLNTLAMVGEAVVTVTQLAMTLLVRLTVPVMLLFALVNATGLATQLALTCPATFRTCTSITQEVWFRSIVAPVTTIDVLPFMAVVTAAALVQVDEPNTPPRATRKLAGNVSVKLMPDCAGFVPEFVSVKRSVVVAPSMNVFGVNALVSTGAIAVMLKQAFAPPVVALVAVMLVCKLVWAACGQVPVVPAVLVTPAKVTVQLTVALAMAKVVKPLMTPVPAL